VVFAIKCNPIWQNELTLQRLGLNIGICFIFYTSIVTQLPSVFRLGVWLILNRCRLMIGEFGATDAGDAAGSRYTSANC